MRWLALGAFAILAGCAKFPDTPPGPGSTRLIFTMTVDGRFRFGSEPGSSGIPYIYMVALRPSTLSNPIDQGPVPVISSPWGNGFVAGNATHFVWWDPTQASQYTLYQFRDATLEQWFPIAVPVSSDVLSSGARRLRFELSLEQLAPSPADAANLRSLQVNFLTMDNAPQGLSGSKAWDALGDGRLPSEVNQYLTVPLNVSALYNNDRSNELEPRGDQADPDLDMVDWSVEVRLQ